MNETIDKAKLMAYVHGELAAAEAREIARRIREDANMRREVEAMMTFSQTLDFHYSSEPEEGLSTEQLEALRKAAGGGDRRVGVSSAFFGWRGAVVSFVTVACALYVVFIVNRVEAPKLATQSQNFSESIGDDDRSVVKPGPTRGAKSDLLINENSLLMLSGSERDGILAWLRARVNGAACTSNSGTPQAQVQVELKADKSLEVKAEPLDPVLIECLKTKLQPSPLHGPAKFRFKLKLN